MSPRMFTEILRGCTASHSPLKPAERVRTNWSERRLANVGKRLANEQFVRNAKPEIVEGARAEERELQGLKGNLEARLAEMG